MFLGMPDMKITEDESRTRGSWCIGYGNNQYFRMNFTRSGGSKFLSMIEFNILNVKGEFKRKGNKSGS